MEKRNAANHSALITRYSDAPWYRQTHMIVWLIRLGVLFFFPFLWLVSILCLTGDIYINGYDSKGRLKKWDIGFKSASAGILTLQVIVFAGFSYLQRMPSN